MLCAHSAAKAPPSSTDTFVSHSKITATMQAELEAGRRSTRIDAHDLIDLFLAIADEIDPTQADAGNTADARR